MYWIALFFIKDGELFIIRDGEALPKRIAERVNYIELNKFDQSETIILHKKDHKDPSCLIEIARLEQSNDIAQATILSHHCITNIGYRCYITHDFDAPYTLVSPQITIHSNSSISSIASESSKTPIISIETDGDQPNTFLPLKNMHPYYPLPLNHKNHLYTKNEKLSTLYTYHIPFSYTDLTDENVFRNIAYLNDQYRESELTITKYEACLRFRQISPAVFKKLYESKLLFELETVPDKRNHIALANYSDFCELLDVLDLCPDDRQTLVSLFDQIHSMLGLSITNRVTKRLNYIIKIYGLHCLADFKEFLDAEHRWPFEKNSDAFAVIASDPSQLKSKLFSTIHPDLRPLAYYLLLPSSSFLQEHALDCQFKPPQHSASLIALMTAQFFNQHLVDAKPETLSDEIMLLIKETRLDYSKRLLHHALYHQARPELALWARELLQNAVDSYAALGFSEGKVQINIFKDSVTDSCVLSMEDSGVGMSLQEVLQFFCIPEASNKRSQDSGFLGGRGVGVFTLYPGSSKICLKTAKGDGWIHEAELIPEYIDDKISDINVSWRSYKSDMPYQGTKIWRYAKPTHSAEFEAALLSGQLETHARFIPKKKAQITLNGVNLNKTMNPLCRIEIPRLGTMTMYQAQENAITAGGLYVKNLGNIIEHLPRMITDVLVNSTNHRGIVIDLPAKTPLTRERSDLANSEILHRYLAPFIFNAGITAYLNLFLQSEALLTELPDDFFCRFPDTLERIKLRNTGVDLADEAQQIIDGKPLKHPEIYQHPQRLTDLLCFIPIFKAKTSADERVKKMYSLVELAAYYQTNKKLPEIESIPAQLAQQLNLLNIVNINKTIQEIIASGIQDNLPAVDFYTNNYLAEPYLELITNLASMIGRCLTTKTTHFGFSTKRNGAFAHTSRQQDEVAIYFNLFVIKELIRGLIDALKTSDTKSLYSIFQKFVETVSHEMIHATQETYDDTTHDRTFYLKQRELLLKNITKMDFTTWHKTIFTQLQTIQKIKPWDGKLDINGLISSLLNIPAEPEIERDTTTTLGPRPR